MAKTGIKLGFEPYSHRDPVSGQTKTFMRTDTARQSSKRLINLKACVADRMRGFKASGSTPKERSQSVRNALSASAKACAGGR